MSARGLTIFYIVRTRAAWEFIEPVAESPRPSHRAGHVMVSHGEKLVVCVIFSHSLVRCVAQVERLALVGRIPNTTIMTLGYTTRYPARGQSLIASVFSHHRGRVILRR